MRSARTAADWARAASSLAECHPLAEELHARHGAPAHWRPVPPAGRFNALARTIAYQQLSGTAAATIWSRVTDGSGTLDPADVLELGEQGLRSRGLSRAKALALNDLTERSLGGDLPLDDMARHSDGAVIEHLTAVRGIGRWSAQMFLIGVLGRVDVWPSGDVGVRNGWTIATGGPAHPAPDELEALGYRFRPYRTVLAWWCWQEADTRLPSDP